MYNEKIVDGNSSDIISQSEDMQIIKYDENIENIKNWMRKEEKKKTELENYMKGT